MSEQTINAFNIRHKEVLDYAYQLSLMQARAKERIKLTEDSREKLDSLKAHAEALTKSIGQYREVHDFAKGGHKICEEFLTEKRRQSTEDVAAAVATASSVVLNCPPVELAFSPNSARVVTRARKDYPVSAHGVIGGAGRSALSAFIRSAILWNSSYQPLLIFDEAFAPMSTETTSTFSTLLKELATRFQIFVIEQKPEIMDAGVDVVFHLVREDDENGEVVTTRDGEEY